MLSVFALLLGASGCFRFPTAKVYGPPPKERHHQPDSEIEADSLTNHENGAYPKEITPEDK